MPSATAAAEYPTAAGAGFEGRLFDASPLGPAGTSAVIFALGAGGFFLAAALAHYPVIENRGLALVRIAPGISLSLLLATALAMSRYADLGERRDADDFSAVFSRPALAAAVPRPVGPIERAATMAAGAAAGAAVVLLTVDPTVLRLYPAVFDWFIGISVVLGVLFARGAVRTARSAQRLRRLIDGALIVELLHVDDLAVIGRQTARSALSWFTIAAVVCLNFIGASSVPTIVSTFLVCAGLGLWILLGPMERVHRRIRAEKSVELKRLRTQIARTSRMEAQDPAAAARLPGLIALEARVQAVREWPFDQSTLPRVAAYVLIPAIPWFGEAIVSDLLHRLAHQG